MNINCLAYYEITTGKTDDTFDPNGSVTRSQMALFLARAADAAGIDLGDAMDMGFTDIGDADNERRNRDQPSHRQGHYVRRHGDVLRSAVDHDLRAD